MTETSYQMTSEDSAWLKSAFSVMSIPQQNISTCFVPKKEYAALSEEEKKFVIEKLCQCVNDENIVQMQYGETALDWYITPTTPEADQKASRVADYMIYGESGKEAFIAAINRQFKVSLYPDSQNNLFVLFAPLQTVTTTPGKVSLAAMSEATQGAQEKHIIAQQLNLTPDERGNYWAVNDPILGRRIYADLANAIAQARIAENPNAASVVRRGTGRFDGIPACVIHRTRNNSR